MQVTPAEYSLQRCYQDLQRKFDLTKAEIDSVERCVEAYDGTDDLCSKITNACKHLFGASDWQQAKNVLHRGSKIKINAECILRFLITKRSGPCENGLQDGADEALTMLQIDEVIEFAVNGATEKLPPLTLPILLRQFKQAREEIKESIAFLKEIVSNDKSLKKIYGSDQHSAAVNINQRLVQYLNIPGINYLLSAKNHEEDSENFFSQLAWVDDIQAEESGNLQRINGALRTMRQEQNQIHEILSWLKSNYKQI